MKKKLTLENSRRKDDWVTVDPTISRSLTVAKAAGDLDTGETGCDKGEITETSWTPYTHTKEYDPNFL